MKSDVRKPGLAQRVIIAMILIVVYFAVPVFYLIQHPQILQAGIMWILGQVPSPITVLPNSTLAGVATVQSNVLSFVGQEEIAHAAAIFATLTATIAFATGFKDRPNKKSGAYVWGLTILSFTVVYTCLRLFYYGRLSSTILNIYPTKSAYYNMNSYWNDVTLATKNPAVAAVSGTFQGLTLSWVVGVLIAVAFVSYLGEAEVVHKYKDTFEKMHRLYKLLFFWAVFDYLFEAIPLTVYLYYINNQNVAVGLGFAISFVLAAAFLFRNVNEFWSELKHSFVEGLRQVRNLLM